MPELPEVETIKRDLSKRIIGLKFADIKVLDSRVIRQISSKKFIQKLKNKTIQNISRRAKALIFHFKEGGYFVVQLRMTGFFLYEKEMPKDKVDKAIKIIFKLSNGSFLYYNDQRTLGWLMIADQLDEIGYLKQAGIEPLNGQFTEDYLIKEFGSRFGPIKNILLNQQIIAGIGNIYASEILHAARIHPNRIAGKLTKHEIKRLHNKTKQILLKAIDCRGSSMRNYRDTSGEKGNFISLVKVYGRENKNCLACRSPIKRIVQAGRSTFFCEKCQH